MSKTIDNIKSGNYEVVDNQGVSVTMHFTQCLEKEFADLESKLAEKDKEIEGMKIDLEAKDFNINSLMEQRKRKQKFYNQDKISFAVEQLEKVKENIKKVPITDFDLSGNFEKMYKQDAIRQIGNQIKQLREGQDV